MTNIRKYIFGMGAVAILIGGYLVLDSMLFNGVKPRAVHESGFQGNFYAKTDARQKAAVVLIGGGEWGDYWAQQFANQGFSGLSLPYTGREGLPTLPEEINLEYFESALQWLGKQPEVDPEKVILMGASRNAELSLVIASTLPGLVGGVVAYAPSSVSWSNTVLAYNSSDLKPSWRFRGAAIPFVPMERLEGNGSGKVETLSYWEKGLAKTAAVGQAAIRVEQINGPILLFSGKDDRVWPSTTMADMIEERLVQNDFQHAFQSFKYENAGHLISAHPEVISEAKTGIMTIDDLDYEYEFGGTVEGDQQAKQDARNKLFGFLEKFN